MVSAVDFHDKYLDFLRSNEKDFSSTFCNELVALLYQEPDLFGENTTCNT